ncbi:MAG: phosphate signaling complex protein PhoU, partial [Planctomycetota bacterium]|nr:phosphate signaling complex protein PhoU [Planctomycetota bacterium]
MSVELKQELTSLRRDLLVLSARAEQRVNKAIEALMRKDVALAREVRHGDSEIDELEVDIEAECMRVLALHHPVAGDLCFIIAAIRINNELERIADLAKGISKRVLDMADRKPVYFPDSIHEMTTAARKMLGDALRALSEQNIELAEQVRRSDKFVDQKLRESFDWADAEIPSHVE